MAKNLYTGIASKSRKVKNVYTGITNKARKIKNIYVGIGNKAKSSFTKSGTGYVSEGKVTVTGNYETIQPVGNNILVIGRTGNAAKIVPSTMVATTTTYPDNSWTRDTGPIANSYVGAYCACESEWNSSWTSVTYSYASTGYIINSSLTSSSISIFKGLDNATATNDKLGFFIGGCTITYVKSSEWEKYVPTTYAYTVNTSGTRSSVTLPSSLKGCGIDDKNSVEAHMDGPTYAIFTDGISVAHDGSGGNKLTPNHYVYAYNQSGANTSCTRHPTSSTWPLTRHRTPHASSYSVCQSRSKEYLFYNITTLTSTSMDSSLGTLYTGPSKYSLVVYGSSIYNLNSLLVKSLIGTSTSGTTLSSGVRIPGDDSYIYSLSGSNIVTKIAV